MNGLLAGEYPEQVVGETVMHNLYFNGIISHNPDEVVSSVRPPVGMYGADLPSMLKKHFGSYFIFSGPENIRGFLEDYLEE